jgi:hypothetical protein
MADPRMAMAAMQNGMAPSSQGAGIAAELMNLLEPVLSSPKGQAMMGQAIQALTGGSDPRAAMAGGMPNGPGGPMVRGGGMPDMANPMGMAGPATDGDLTEMLNQADAMRPDLPPQKRDGYTGADPEDEPMDDPRQTPPSTEEELEMVRQMMGGGDPVADGNFPSQQEINALLSGKIDEKAFDAKWGKGAAVEILKGDEEDNQGHPARHYQGESEYDDEQGHDD